MERLPTYVPRVLLVGTGLTMIDLALAIAERRPDVRMTAISRHGLLPQPHEDGTHRPASKFDATALLGRGPLSERLRRFRAQVVASGGDWRAALQQVREVMPALWRAAPRRLRRRFLRHLRAHWDVHRHRVPAETLQRIEKMREKKRLEVRAGRIVETRRIKDGIVVAWRPRGSEAVREELFDAVVNVTGPDGDPNRSSCALVKSLVDQATCANRTGLASAGARTRTDACSMRTATSRKCSSTSGRCCARGTGKRPPCRSCACTWRAPTAAIAASLATGAGSYIRRIATPIFRREQQAY